MTQTTENEIGSCPDWHSIMRRIDMVLSSSVVEDSFGPRTMFEFRQLRDEFKRMETVCPKNQ